MTVEGKGTQKTQFCSNTQAVHQLVAFVTVATPKVSAGLLIFLLDSARRARQKECCCLFTMVLIACFQDGLRSPGLISFHVSTVE